MATPEEHLDRIKRAVDADVPNIYFNAFSTSIGPGDTIITLERNGKPVAVLNTSFTMAKTLAIKLGDVVQALEEATGNRIMTSDDIEKAGQKGKENEPN